MGKPGAHRHAETHSNNIRRIRWALLLIGGFAAVEAVGGILSGSLALLADAAHMLVDTVSLLFAWIAFSMSRRPADRAHTYGYHRLPVLAAYTNGLLLVFLVGWIMFEAVDRFRNPAPILAGPMLAVAVLGLLVNIGAFSALHGADRHNLNVRGALLHVLGDILGSVAAISAAIVIMLSGWTPIDPLLSVFVGLVVLRSAWFLLRDASRILLEGAPPDMDVEEIRRDLVTAVDGVDEIHHVHAWSLSQERSLLTLHARMSGTAQADAVIAAIHSRLDGRFGIRHATVQVEAQACADGQANGAGPADSRRPSAN